MVGVLTSYDNHEVYTLYLMSVESTSVEDPISKRRVGLEAAMQGEWLQCRYPMLR